MYIKNKKMTIGTLLGILCFIVFTAQYILPGTVTILLKPISICIGLVISLLSGNKLKIQIVTVACFLLIIDNIRVLLIDSTERAIMLMFTNVSYLAFFIVFASFEYTLKDLRFILKMVYCSTLILSFGILVSNKFITFDYYRMSKIQYFNSFINVNLLGYLVIPGLVIGFIYFIYLKKGKLYIALSIILMMYPIFYTSSRGAIVSLIIAFIICFRQSIIKIATERAGVIRSTVIVLGIGMVVILLIKYIPSEIFGRFTESDDLFNGNGRINLWIDAFQISSTNFLTGGGANFWNYATNHSMEYGAHNIFMDYFVSNGILGLIIILSYFTSIILYIKSPELFALASGAFMFSILESGVGYVVSIPLILSCVVQKTFNHKKINFNTLFE